MLSNHQFYYINNVKLKQETDDDNINGPTNASIANHNNNNINNNNNNSNNNNGDDATMEDIQNWIQQMPVFDFV